MVESLLYRMRADPVVGYKWYLKQADQAIRSAQTGLDMRLRDAIGIFLNSASPQTENEVGQSLSSPIDVANIDAMMPEIFDDLHLDSATLWIKRYTMRGRIDQAVQIGETAREWAEGAFNSNPRRYRLPLAEYFLWMDRR